VDSLRGSINVASKAAEGTTVTLRLPLTLAIIDGLLVSIGDAFFVLPLANVLECVELTQADVERANGKHIADVRGRSFPTSACASTSASARRARRSSRS